MAGNPYLWSTTAAANDSIDSDINWAEFQNPSTVNNSARALMAAVAGWRRDKQGELTATGTNTLLLSSSIAYSTLTTGLEIGFSPSAANTLSATLQVNGLVSKTIRILHPLTGVESAIQPGYLQTTGKYRAVYNAAANSGTGAWLLTNPTVSLPLSHSAPVINASFALTATGSALTISLKTRAGNDPSNDDPVVAFFRNITGTAGDISAISIITATSLTISSGSTLAITASKAFRLWFVGLNDTGTFRLGVFQSALRTAGNEQISPIPEGLASATGEGGAGTADNSGVIYANAGVTSKPVQVLGFAEWNASGLAAAGAWTITNLSKVELVNPLTRLPGQTVQRQTLVSSPNISTTVTTFVSTTISLSIVPNNAANMIEVSSTGYMQNTNLTAGIDMQLSRGTVANTSLIGSRAQLVNGGGSIIVPGFVQAMDFPNTASAQAYGIQFRAVTGGTAFFGGAVPMIQTITEYQT